MIKLVCGKCAQTWYTSSTSINQECGECGARLVEVDFIASKGIENISMMEFSGSNIKIERK